MPSTYCRILFGRNDAIIKSDYDTYIVSIGGELATISEPAALMNQLLPLEPLLATFESNFFLLDGKTFRIAADSSPGAGYCSSSLSIGDGTFASNPTIEFQFLSEHDTLGLNICTGTTEEYATQVDVTLSNSLDSAYYPLTPTGPNFTVPAPIFNYDTVTIVVKKTNKGLRHARVIGINFDLVTEFGSEEIKTSKVVQEISPISTEVPISVIDFKLVSAQAGFSVTNPTGVYANLQYKEPIEVYEIVDGSSVFIGKFYLDEWDSPQENVAVFQASDAIGLLEGETFYCPKNTISTPEQFLDAIAAAANVTFDIDPNFDINYSDSFVWDTYTGTLPVMNCRLALQHMLFIVGAYATCVGSHSIKILPMVLASSLSVYDHTLTADDVAFDSPVKLRKMVTGVEVFSQSFAKFYYEGSSQDIFDGSLAVGTHTLVFNNYYPIFNTTITGTASLSIVSEGRNWVVLNVTSAGTVIITQAYYLKVRSIQLVISNGSLPAGTKPNIMSIREAYMVFPDIHSEVTQRVYDYHQQRHIQKTKVFGYPMSVGDSVLIDTQSAQQIKGHVERMEIDLANGYVSTIDIIGDVV